MAQDEIAQDETADDELKATVVAGRAMLSAGRFERAQISLRLGVIAAIPVAGMLAVGTLIGRPVAAVTMAVGAMLSGVAWRAGGGETRPLGTMTAAAGGLVLATLCGTLSGRWPWLHLGVLALFCLGAGLLSALGRRGSVVGTQSVIAFVVFGRFPEAVGPAFALAGLVAIGAGVQITFAAVVALPPAWRAQRASVADAYERLAELALAPHGSSGSAAAALESAERRLSAPALLADPAAMALADLVQEGRRIRLSVAALSTAIDPAIGNAEPDPRVAAALGRAAGALRGVAGIVRDRSRPSAEPGAGAGAQAATDLSPPSFADDGLGRLTAARLAAVLGQVAAAARMAERARGWGGMRHLAHPTLGSRMPLSQLPFDIRRLRANATLQSAAGRHAVRLAVVATGTELLTQRVALPRGYWAVVAATTVLRPEFGATITRGVERVVGTCGGVVIATLIAVGLRPDAWGITVIVGLLAALTYAVFPASFAAGTAGLTAMIVFLLHAVAPDSLSIALDRGIDTAIGGAIGVTAYLLWPTWSGASVGRLLADVVEAQRDYLHAVIEGLIGGVPARDEHLRSYARRARIAFSDADGAVTLSLTEPVHGADPGAAANVLSVLRRLVYGVHALRIDGATIEQERPLPMLRALSAGFDAELGMIAGRLRGAVQNGVALPALRLLFRDAVAELPEDAVEPLCGPLDELVDATNSVAGVAGIDPR